MSLQAQACVNACAGVSVRSVSPVQTEEMRLSTAIWWLKVALAVTLRNMCCVWEGEGGIAQHASHHCKHVRAERQAFPNKHRADRTAQLQGSTPIGYRWLYKIRTINKGQAVNVLRLLFLI